MTGTEMKKRIMQGELRGYMLAVQDIQRGLERGNHRRVRSAVLELRGLLQNTDWPRLRDRVAQAIAPFPQYDFAD